MHCMQQVNSYRSLSQSCDFSSSSLSSPSKMLRGFLDKIEARLCPWAVPSLKGLKLKLKAEGWNLKAESWRLKAKIRRLPLSGLGQTTKTTSQTEFGWLIFIAFLWCKGNGKVSCHKCTCKCTYFAVSKMKFWPGSEVNAYPYPVLHTAKWVGTGPWVFAPCANLAF